MSEIASLHPEFAAAIGAHPNTAPELQRWAATWVKQQGEVVAGDRAGGARIRSVSGFGVATMILVVVAGGVSVLGEYLYDAGVRSGTGSAASGLPLLLVMGPVVLAVGLLCLAAFYRKGVGRILGAVGILVVPTLVIVSLVGYSEFGFELRFWAIVGVDYVPFLLSIGFVIAYAVVRPVRGLGWIGFALTLLLVASVSFLLRGAPQIVGVAVFLALGVLLCEVLSAVSERARARSLSAAAGGPNALAGAAGVPEKTNTLAILSLVLSLTVYVAGIILGHVALSQIRRTGEGGRGLAIAALIIGYTLVGLVTVLLIVYIAIAASLV